MTYGKEASVTQYNHRAGSRKQQVHACFDQRGEAVARKLGRSLGLSEATLRTWFSTWRHRPVSREPGGSVLGSGAAKSTKVRLGPEGRIVVPAPFREALGLKEGDVLFAHLEGGEIALLTPRAAMRRAQAMVRQFVPEGVSLVDELIEDRRREAQRENENG
jgi:AbrB family looped-hinge helix DNA binding protein